MKKKYQGNARAKWVQLQGLRSEFETLRMKSGETVVEYISRMMAIANKMWIHGDKIEDVAIVEKILRSMLPKFNFVVCSIEESKDIDTLSIDELQSSLQVYEQKLVQQDMEEQALQASTNNQSSTPSRRGRGRGSGFKDHKNQQQQTENQSCSSQGRGKGCGRSHTATHGPRSHDKSNLECYRCHRCGHYKFECQTNLSKNSGERSNFAEKDEKEEELSLLMVCHAKEENKRTCGTWTLVAAITCVEINLHLLN